MPEAESFDHASFCISATTVLRPAWARSILLGALLWCINCLPAKAAVTPATGGTEICVDDYATGTWTTLTGPSYAEDASGEITSGTIVFDIPEGFELNTSASPTLSIYTNLHDLSPVVPFSGNPVAPTSVTSTQIVFEVSGSTASPETLELTWSGIQLRPASGNLPAGELTVSGTALLSGNFGTLGTVAGEADKLEFIAAPVVEVAGRVFTNSPAVRALDQFENATTNLSLADSLVSVCLIRSSAGQAGILSGNTILDLADTPASLSFDNLQLNMPGSNCWQLVASNSLLGSATSTVFTVLSPFAPAPLGANLSPNLTLSNAAGPAGLWLGNLRGNRYPGYSPSIGLLWRDLIIANSASNSITVRPYIGENTFGNPITYPAGLEPVAVRSGFFSDLSFEDVVVANHGTNTVTFYQVSRNGLCTLTNQQDLVVGSTPNPGPVSLCHAWVSGPSYADLFVANSNECTVSALYNYGGGLLLASNYPVGQYPTSVSIADLNGDNEPDILTANKGDGSLTILRGLPNHTFESYMTIPMTDDPQGDPQPCFALPGDLNGDGLIDIVVANYNSNTVSVLKQQPDHSFEQVANYEVGTHPKHFLLRDINRDKKIDIVVVNTGSASMDVLLGLGNCSFEPNGRVPTGSNPACIVGSNLNGDRATDVVVSSLGDDSVQIFLFGGALAEDHIVTTFQNKPVSMNLAATAGNLGYRVVTAPAHGSITNTGSNFIYTPQSNYFGSDSFEFCSYRTNYDAADAFQYPLDGDGFNTNLASRTALVSINVIPVNGAPSFSIATNAILLNRGGIAQNYLNFATDLDPGTSNTNWQALRFLLTVTNTSFYSQLPVLSTNGTLTFTPGSAAAGTNYVMVRLQNSGGLANAGENTSTPQTFAVVIPPNEPPSFSLPNTTLTVYTRGAAVVLPSFATDIVPGPVNEDWQSLSFVLTVTNASFYSVRPVLASNGTLSFTPAPSAGGTNYVRVYLRDNGATMAGSTNYSGSRVFAIIVPINTAPTFQLATNWVALTQSRPTASTIPNFATGISAGATNESWQTLTFVLTVTNSSFYSVRPTISTNGTLIFRPAATVNGTNYVTVTLKDNGPTSAGGRNSSDPQVFAIAVPNPYGALKLRTFNGLFYEESAVSPQSSGFISVQITTGGVGTGKIIMGGVSYPFANQFDFSGHSAPVQVVRNGLTPLTVTLNLDVTGTDRMTGTVTDGTWTAQVQGDRNIFDGRTSVPSQVGRYTLALPGSQNAALSPAGAGYGVVTVNSNGTIVLSGKLGDGTLLSRTVPISKNADWPLYAPLYSGKGLVMGWLHFSNSPAVIGGQFAWIKPTTLSTLYRFGFTNENSAVGSLYIRPVNTRVLDITNGTVTLTGGNLTASQTNTVVLQTNNVLLVQTPPTNNLAITFQTNGVFTGRFFNSTTKRTSTLYGVVLQNQKQARGYFLGTNQSGSVTLTGE